MIGSFDIQALGDRIAAGIRAFGGVLPTILANPKAYPKEAMLLASILALLVLVVFLFGYALATWVAAMVRRRRLGVHPYRGRLRRAALVLLMAAVVGFGLLVLAPYTKSGSKACDGCHATAAPVAAWAEGAHADVACYACHTDATVLSGVEVGAREFGRYAGSEGPGPAASSRRCMRCHSELQVKLSRVDGLRVSHKEIIAGGESCVECHADVGHERPSGKEPSAALVAAQEASVGERSMMSRCLACHDGVRAHSTCSTCHEDGPLDRASSSTVDGQGSVSMRTSCAGCHAQETRERCTGCHGLEMPHPAGFRAKHAGLSWDKPSLCTRCHETASANDGCACHAELTIHGTYSEWFPRHMGQATQSGPAGCRCHDDADCEACHEQRPTTAETAQP